MPSRVISGTDSSALWGSRGSDSSVWEDKQEGEALEAQGGLCFMGRWIHGAGQPLQGLGLDLLPPGLSAMSRQPGSSLLARTGPDHTASGEVFMIDPIFM